MRARYRYGTLTTKQTRRGQVWIYRFQDGLRRRAVTLGLVKQVSEREARKQSEPYQLIANRYNPVGDDILFGALLDRYEESELPERQDTKRMYQSFIRNHIRPAWSRNRLSDIAGRGSAFRIEDWLRSLPLAPKTKGNIKAIMSTVLKSAERWGLIDVGSNPMQRVRVKGVSKRLSAAPTIDPEQIRKLLTELKNPYLLMVALACCSGLRCSELFGLMWKDVDWNNLTLRVERGWVEGALQPVKTRYSEHPMPLDPDLADMLLSWQRETPYRSGEDFIFASGYSKQKKPCSPKAALENHIRPAATRAGLSKEISWQSFRRSFSTLLRANGEDLKVQQSLLRHADIRTTMNLYTDVVTDQMREAQGRVAKQILGS